MDGNNRISLLDSFRFLVILFVILYHKINSFIKITSDLA
jgi:hypothetical protein